jgi:PTS system N-acetylglucosamine-specific IIC component
LLHVVFGSDAPALAEELRALLQPSSLPVPPDSPTTRAQGFIVALGGANNLRQVDACTTRLRLEVVDNALVNESDLRALGARGVICPAPGSVQVVLGPIADQVASDIRDAMHVDT